MTYTEVLDRLKADAELLGVGCPVFGMTLDKAKWAASGRLLRCAAALIDIASVDLVEDAESDALVTAYESALKDWPVEAL